MLLGVTPHKRETRAIVCSGVLIVEELWSLVCDGSICWNKFGMCDTFFLQHFRVLCNVLLFTLLECNDLVPTSYHRLVSCPDTI